MIEDLKINFPPECVVYGVEQANLNDLYQQEKQIVEDFGDKPKEQFCMGRRAAHLCLEDFKASMPVLRGKNREPLWPNHLVGSITHTRGIAIAVVAEKDVISGVGIDCEYIARKMNLKVAKRFTTKFEQDWIFADDTKSQQRLLKILSAKEAIFKTFFPMEEVYLNFLDAQILPSEKGFRAILFKKPTNLWDLNTDFEVNQCVYKDYLISSVYLRANE